jgi:DNA-binding PadR family transcriptional regulator
MVEARLLSLVAASPHPAALARQVRDGALFTWLRRLEEQGLVTRRRGLYRLTLSGRDELSMARALTRLVARSGPLPRA